MQSSQTEGSNSHKSTSQLTRSKLSPKQHHNASSNNSSTIIKQENPLESAKFLCSEDELVDKFNCQYTANNQSTHKKSVGKLLSCREMYHIPGHKNPSSKEKLNQSDGLGRCKNKLDEPPFLENPVLKILQGTQSMLSANNHEIIEFLNSPRQSPSKYTKTSAQDCEPTPEDILKLYSQDLGISHSASPSQSSPRPNFDYKFTINKKSISTKGKLKCGNNDISKNVINSSGNKSQPKNNSMRITENRFSYENRLNEVKKIYCSTNDKMVKPSSDSTLGSKSKRRRNRLSIKDTNNVDLLRKTRSNTITRKREIKKMEMNPVTDLNGDDSLKASRVSKKRKCKIKHSSVKGIKSDGQNMKIEAKSENFHEMKLRDNQQINRHDSDKIVSSDDKLNKNITFNKQSKSKKNKLLRENNISHESIKNNSNAIPKPAPPARHNYSVKQTQETRDLNNYEKNKYSKLKKQSNRDKTEQIGISGDVDLHNNTSEESKLNQRFTEKVYKSSYDKVNYSNTNMSIDNEYEGLLDELPQLHYTLPTQSSKSKEVERFLNGAYHHLPFVMAQSTNKSHNLWVNIQEVLSLIQQQNPHAFEVEKVVGGFDNEDDKAISVSSNISMKSLKKTHQCPALQHEPLYDIPETNEADSSWENHPECIQANIDPNGVKPRCCCQSQPSVGYKKVLLQLFGGGDISSEASDEVVRFREEIFQDQAGELYIDELKNLLISSTQEFEELNAKHEVMLKNSNTSKKELLQLENILQNKEEAIQDLMSKCQEVKSILFFFSVKKCTI